MYVSTVSPAQQSHSEAVDHPGAVCGPPSHHSVPPGPTVTKGVCLGRQGFLLAMASVERHSELQALVFDLQYILFKPKGAGVKLYFSPEFMRENQETETKPVTRGTFQRF